MTAMSTAARYAAIVAKWQPRVLATLSAEVPTKSYLVFTADADHPGTFLASTTNVFDDLVDLVVGADDIGYQLATGLKYVAGDIDAYVLNRGRRQIPSILQELRQASIGVLVNEAAVTALMSTENAIGYLAVLDLVDGDHLAVVDDDASGFLAAVEAALEAYEDSVLTARVYDLLANEALVLDTTESPFTIVTRTPRT